jgi:hypothetical protein
MLNDVTRFFFYSWMAKNSSFGVVNMQELLVISLWICKSSFGVKKTMYFFSVFWLDNFCRKVADFFENISKRYRPICNFLKLIIRKIQK